MEWSIEDCFSCGSCPSTLDEHRRTQTGEKLYDCDICHSSHIRKFELVLHVKKLNKKKGKKGSSTKQGKSYLDSSSDASSSSSQDSDTSKNFTSVV